MGKEVVESSIYGSKEISPSVKKLVEGQNNRLLEWLELLEKIEELEKQMVLEEDKDTDSAGQTKAYYILINWEKVAYFEYIDIDWYKEVTKFGTSNWKKFLWEIQQDMPSLSSKLEWLSSRSIKFLGKASFVKMLDYFKQNNITSLYLSQSYFAYKNDFYKTTLSFLKEIGKIYDYEIDNRMVYLEF